MPDILDTPITFLPNVLRAHVFSDWPLKKALKAVKAGIFKDSVLNARTAFQEGDEEKYKKLKLNLPSFAFNGTFKGRVTNANFIKSSSIIILDIDKLSPKRLISVKKALTELPFIAFAFESVSGQGLKCGVCVDPGAIQDDSDIKFAFGQLSHYFSSRGIAVDPSGKDARRVCFVGYDPELHYKRSPERFPLEIPHDNSDQKEAEDLDQDPNFSVITEDDFANIVLENITLENAAEYLPPPGEQSRDEWLRVGMALHFQFNGSLEALALFDTWSSAVREYKGFADVEKEWLTFGRRKTGALIDFRTLIKQHNGRTALVAKSKDTVAMERGREILEDCDNYLELVRSAAPKLWKLANKSVALENHFVNGLMARYAVLNPGTTLTKADALRALKMRHKKKSEDLAVLHKLKTNEDGMYIPSVSNVLIAISCPELTGMHIGWDSFTAAIMKHGHGENWEAFQDVHYTDLKLVLDERNFLEVSTERIREVVHKVAQVNVFDSAQDWLETVEWDGVPRIEGFLENYLGVKASPYAKAVSNYLWTALPGRVLVPGIKADMMLIMRGSQGTFKSTTVGSLVPSPEFMCNFSFADKEDDVSRKFRGRLVAEIGELKGLGSKDEEHIKDFIVRQQEDWTPKYKEYNTVYKRRVILIGTTNLNHFLHDPTGHRRFLPFNVGYIDIEKILADREQLWAEGAVTFKQTGIAFRDAEVLAVHEHSKYVIQDDWGDSVSAWLRSSNEIDMLDISKGVTTTEIMAGALSIPAKHANAVTKRRIASIMAFLEYSSQYVERDGIMGWYWLKDTKTEALRDDEDWA